MGRILSIETATRICSVALSEEGKVLNSQFLDEGYQHDENLLPLIQRLLGKGSSGIKPDAVAVSGGPGSYTGLRIGVSAAKGLCFALDIPLIAISTLEIFANGFRAANPGFDGLICPMIDARRMEVYTAVFGMQGQRFREDHPLVVTGDAFAAELEKGFVAFFGDGAEKCRELLGKHPNARFGLNADLNAAFMCQIAEERLRNKQFEELAYFEPEYLKPYQGTPPKPV